MRACFSNGVQNLWKWLGKGLADLKLGLDEAQGEEEDGSSRRGVKLVSGLSEVKTILLCSRTNRGHSWVDVNVVIVAFVKLHLYSTTDGPFW